MFLGSIKANFIPLASFLLGVGSIIVVYFISQYLGHEKPFPDTWISATADHYPEFVVFRIGTISGAVLMALSHLICYFWVMTLGYEKVFNIGKYKPQYGAVMGVAGALFLMGSTANLDTGKHNTGWHVFCAGNAFVWSIFSGWYHTYISCVLYSKTKAVSFNSTLAKVILSVAILFQALLDSTAVVESDRSLGGSRLSNALEYTIAFSTFGFFLMMVLDMKDFKLLYREKRQLSSS